MLARVRSSLLQGIDALPCEVEVDFDPTAIEKQLIVGLPDAAVKESLERVGAALGNSGYYPPPGRLLINLAPADLKKEGPVYDLPIAVGMLAVGGVIRERAEAGLDYRHAVMAGELALDGRVRPIKGALALASMARATGAKAAIVPAENAAEASIVGGIEVFGVRTLAELVGLLTGQLDVQPHPAPDVGGILRQAEAPIDFAEVRGQEGVKRAITIAAAGGHNLLGLCPCGGHGGGGLRQNSASLRGGSSERCEQRMCQLLESGVLDREQGGPDGQPTEPGARRARQDRRGGRPGDIGRVGVSEPGARADHAAGTAAGGFEAGAVGPRRPVAPVADRGGVDAGAGRGAAVGAGG